MEEIAYGIYEGCIYEGGGTGGTLYKKKDDAIAEAVRVFENHITRDVERANHERDDEFMIEHLEQYKWRKCDKQENRWHNTVSEIEVVEYIIK